MPPKAILTASIGDRFVPPGTAKARDVARQRRSPARVPRNDEARPQSRRNHLGKAVDVDDTVWREPRHRGRSGLVQESIGRVLEDHQVAAFRDREHVAPSSFTHHRAERALHRRHAIEGPDLRGRTRLPQGRRIEPFCVAGDGHQVETEGLRGDLEAGIGEGFASHAVARPAQAGQGERDAVLPPCVRTTLSGATCPRPLAAA